MLLASPRKRSLRKRSLRKQSARKTTSRSTKSQMSAEVLEARQLLTTTFFLDFGTGFAAEGLETTAEEFREVHNGTEETGTDLIGHKNTRYDSSETIVATDDLVFTRLDYDFDGDDDSGDVADARSLQNEVISIVRRALAPFDIDVASASATDLDDVSDALDRNERARDGNNDAYMFVATVTSSRFTRDGGSVGINTRLFGKAASLDLSQELTPRRANLNDEATLTFADNIFNATAGVQGTDEFNRNLAHRIAYTAVHEGLHTFDMSHTAGPGERPQNPPTLEETADQRMLASGDAIQFNSQTRETTNIVTRFPLRLEHDARDSHNFIHLACDADIGLVDRNDNGVPDFAYVTGTGAHDRITLTQRVDGSVAVTVEAFRNRRMLSRDLIASQRYTVRPGVDTDRGIVIDTSVNDDLVRVNSDFDMDVTIRGGDGNDRLYGGSGDDHLYGEAGDDMLFGNAGDDKLSGQAGNDVVVGGAGDDWMAGNDGRDILIGGVGTDILQGGAGDDILIGGSSKWDRSESALNNIRNEWTSNSGWLTRARHLNGQEDGGLNGPVHELTANRITHDADRDYFRGGEGRDWFWKSDRDVLYDWSTNEGLNSRLRS